MIPHHISVDSTVCRIREKLSPRVCGLFAVGDKVNDISSFYSNVYLHFPFFFFCFWLFFVWVFFHLVPYSLTAHFFQLFVCTLGFSITSILPIWGALF